MSAEVLKTTESSMAKSIEHLREKLLRVRTGRATITMLDDIRVTVYGSEMPLNQLASLATPDAHQITIQAWDKTIVPAIEKAILKSSLGLTPSTQGEFIRINIPQLTEDRRTEYTKIARALGEEAKVALRNIRRDSNAALEKLKKEGDLPEDDHHKALDEVQKITNSYVTQVESVITKKEADIMEV